MEWLVQQISAQKIPDEIYRSLKQMQTTLKGFQDVSAIYEDIGQSLKAIKQLSKDFQNGAPVYADIRRTLKSIEQLTTELQPLSKSLNEHPSSLIFDKSPTPDLLPKTGFANE
jgi:paraquat-inducible protein B